MITSKVSIRAIGTHIKHLDEQNFHTKDNTLESNQIHFKEKIWITTLDLLRVDHTLIEM